MPKAATPTPVIYTNEQIINAATGQWGEIIHEVKPAEPIPIQVPESDKVITVLPLTRRRRKALKASQAAYLMVGAQLAEAQNAQDADQGTIGRIQSVLDDSEAAYDKALFGDAYEEVVNFFEDIDEVWWDTMYQAVHDKLVNRITPPEDACAKCGRPFEEAGEGEEGKGESSSTSSTGTGTKLRAISDTS